MRGTGSLCVLWGGYGGGNVGDELTLAVALRDAVARHGERNVAVLTRNAPWSGHLFPGIRMVPYLATPAVPRWYEQVGILGRRLMGLPPGYLRYVPDKQRPDGGPEPEWMTVMRSAAELRLVGGGYLADHFDIEYTLLPVHWANRLGVPVSSAPLGLGPFFRPGSEALVKRELARASLVVRDPVSQAIAARLALRAELRPDDGFRFRDVLGDVEPRRSGHLRIGVNVSRQPGEESDAEAWWVDAVRALAAWPGVVLAGFCFHANPFLDHLATARVFREAGLAEGCVAPPPLDFREAVRAVGAFDAVFTARFHAAVVANVLGRPGIAVAGGAYYRAKMAAAVEGAARMEAADPRRTTPGEAAGRLRALHDGGREAPP